MLKYALAGGLTLAVVAPVWAADEYFIVRGPDRHCTVVEERPTTTTITVVGDTVYKTRSEAETAIKEVCTTTDEDDDED
jgi:hypothetical protein